MICCCVFVFRRTGGCGGGGYYHIVVLRRTSCFKYDVRERIFRRRCVSVCTFRSFDVLVTDEFDMRAYTRNFPAKEEVCFSFGADARVSGFFPQDSRRMWEVARNLQDPKFCTLVNFTSF